MNRPSLLSRIWYRFIKCLCWAVAVLFFRFRWTGQEHVPASGPLLILSNHQSHLDPVMIGIACPRQLSALAKKSLFVGPFGWLIRSLGAFPIDLESSGLGGVRTSLKVLKQGAALLVFPEGARSWDGRLTPLLPGFCALARRSGATIVPLGIDGAHDALPRGSSWPRFCPISLRFGPPIEPERISQLTDDQLVELVTARIAACLP